MALGLALALALGSDLPAPVDDAAAAEDVGCILLLISIRSCFIEANAASFSFMSLLFCAMRCSYECVLLFSIDDVAPFLPSITKRSSTLSFFIASNVSTALS